MTHPRRVLILLALPAAIATPVALAAGNGGYKGKVSGDQAMSLKVKNNRLTSFKASIYASCGYQNFNITVAYPPAGKRGQTAKIRNNRFKVVFKGDPSVDDKRTVTGTFRGSKVSGRINVEGTCSAKGTYSAKR
ncbi:MAG TPA: hypothetical protein VFD31_08320 [Thermoleophilaceae bacterium]|nr:hypothetical protein [Thermoleophilaceae bacterium]